LASAGRPWRGGLRPQRGALPRRPGVAPPSPASPTPSPPLAPATLGARGHAVAARRGPVPFLAVAAWRGPGSPARGRGTPLPPATPRSPLPVLGVWPRAIRPWWLADAAVRDLTVAAPASPRPCSVPRSVPAARGLELGRCASGARLELGWRGRGDPTRSPVPAMVRSALGMAPAQRGPDPARLRLARPRCPCMARPRCLLVACSVARARLGLGMCATRSRRVSAALRASARVVHGALAWIVVPSAQRVALCHVRDALVYPLPRRAHLPPPCFPYV
jgi:hypothetical protein